MKSAAFTAAGRVLAEKADSVPLLDSGDPLIHEIDPQVWIRTARGLIAGLLRDAARKLARGDSSALEAISVSGNGPTLLALDAAGRPLIPAMSWLDRRAGAEALEASAAAGMEIDSSFVLPKVLWIKRHRPEIYGRTKAFISCPEYLYFMLTGEALTIVPEGYEAYYSEPALLEKLDIDPAKFPPPVRPGERSAPLSPAGCAAFGLGDIQKGGVIKAVAAGPDYLAALVGTGTTAPGRACDRAGTSEGINLCALHGVDDRRLISVPHIVRPYFNISGLISTTGAALAWWKSNAEKLSGRAVSYEQLFETLAHVPAGARGLIFLPYLTGERSPIWDSGARGAFIGLDLNQGADEMGRAVLESSAFAMRDVISAMEEDGASVNELRITGKPARSHIWNQIKADITGKPIIVPRFEDAELPGDLAFALCALGRAGSLADAAESLALPAGTFEPDQTKISLYDELFAAYTAAYTGLKPVYARLGSAQSR